MVHDHRPGRISFIADVFAGYLNSLAEEALIGCEQEIQFREVYEQWRATFTQRGAYEAVRDELRNRRIVSTYRGKIIISPPSQPQRAAARVRELSLRANDPILDNQGGIIVSEFVFHQNLQGERIVIQNGYRITAEGYIHNESVDVVDLRQLRPHHTHWKFRFYVVTGPAANQRRRLRFPLVIHPDDRVRIAAQFTAQTNVATVNTLFKFTLAVAVPGSDAFVIGRKVTVHVGDEALQTQMAPTAPYQPRPRRRATRPDAPTQVVEGERPAGMDDNNPQYKGPLQYQVPREWAETCRLGEAGAILAEARANLSAATLRTLYHNLLWTEELQMDKDILGYSKDNVVLHRDRAFLVLEVPGLAEKRPSVLKGDSVLVHRANQADQEVLTKYKGYVHEVQRDQVRLKFYRSFHQRYVDGEKVNVEFTYNRMTLRISHQAVDKLTPELTAHILPSPEPEGYPLALQGLAIHPVNRTLNDEQLLAVKRIVQKSNTQRNCPYIIYGPPGTGECACILLVVLAHCKPLCLVRISVNPPENMLCATVLLIKLFRYCLVRAHYMQARLRQSWRRSSRSVSCAPPRRFSSARRATPPRTCC